MAKLAGHVLGLKTRSSLVVFVIIIQPILTEGLRYEQVTVLSETHFPQS